ncbi:AcrR family transcriptional regulator [Elusimicrobium posterum]|uniref:TetR/AcrR family transcriptional regulator n=1 Tax=Elusimicrobium posterum TaxID=3116653 RepID=UPI003C752AAB
MTKQKIKEEKRNVVIENLLDIAEKLFFSKGYESTTIDEIAKQSNLTKKTIYTYLESKEEIYDRVAARGYKKLYTHLLNAGAKKINPEKELADFLKKPLTLRRKMKGT